LQLQVANTTADTKLYHRSFGFLIVFILFRIFQILKQCEQYET
jgi:hypothetical protein